MCLDVSTVKKVKVNMSNEKTKKEDVKKADEKKQNDFWNNIKGLSKVDTHLKNLQKLSDKIEVKGLSNFVPFSNDIVTIYNEVKAQAEKSSLNVKDAFKMSQFRQRMYSRVGYPSEKTPDGKYIRNSVFETATTRALKLALLLVNKTAGICVKEYKVYAISKEIYPDVKVISGADSSLTYVANQSNELILLTVKGLETLYKRIAPTDSKTVDATSDNITEKLKQIKSVLNAEILHRQKDADYIMDKYGKTDFETINQIAKLSVRLSEQYVRDNANDTEDGKTKDTSVISISSVSYEYKNNKGQVLGNNKVA
tara:strand:+ start:353 stop:1285 length:933 start_codon:yes stop_codon:yes gene_type:complete